MALLDIAAVIVTVLEIVQIKWYKRIISTGIVYIHFFFCSNGLFHLHMKLIWYVMNTS